VVILSLFHKANKFEIHPRLVVWLDFELFVRCNFIKDANDRILEEKPFLIDARRKIQTMKRKVSDLLGYLREFLGI
jgi:hypothetical protein